MSFRNATKQHWLLANPTVISMHIKGSPNDHAEPPAPFYLPPPLSPGVAPFNNVLAGDKGSLRLSEVIATTKKG